MLNQRLVVGVVLAGWLLPFGSMAEQPQNSRLKARAFVSGSVARLREAPKSKADVVAKLRIGTEVEVLSTKRVAGRRWRKVRTGLPEETGWVAASLLSRQRPERAKLLAKAQKAGSAARARTWWERAAALAPGDLEVIAGLRDCYAALERTKSVYYVEKGLIAAERRALSWDGPLYPIEAGIAWLPRAARAGVTATSRDDATRAGTLEKDRKALRGRAFPLVNSGKVVAITEVGYRTRKLDAPVVVSSPCGGQPQAGFALAAPGTRGALVPSWLVAGFRVYPFRPLTDSGSSPGAASSGAAPLGDSAETASHRGYIDARGQITISVSGAEARVTRWAFDEPTLLMAGTLPRPDAVPVAQFSEHEDHVLVLFSAPADRACCSGGREVWLERFEQIGQRAPSSANASSASAPNGSAHEAKPEAVRTTGRLYSSAYKEGCTPSPFKDLPGEPRCERLPEGCELGEPRWPRTADGAR